jgi:endonuclease-3
MRPAEVKRQLKRVLRLLEKDFGPRPWRPGGSAVGELVGTILSQNTTGRNAGAGFRQLWRRFRSYSGMADAPVGEIERCIRVCGLSRVKAPRIKRILQEIRGRGGGRRVSLQFLRDWPDRKAYEYLRAFDGVGPKTAACVLMFAFGKRVFPVDTHIHRIALRLGVLGPRTSPEQAQESLTPWIAPAERYAMHVLLIAHGRSVCRARNPRCEFCSLLRLCPQGNRHLRRSGRK